MSIEIADLVRIFELNPNDDYVTKRTAAVADIRERLKSKQPNWIAFANALAEAFSTGEMPEPLASEVDGALRAASSSFVREGQGVQMLVCAFAAARQLVIDARPTGTWSGTETFTAALLSALQHLPPHQTGKVEELRQEFVSSARALLEQSADMSRRRVKVPDFDAPTATSDDNLQTYAPKLKAAVNKTIAVLESNAVTDREEVDLLWWALSNWSDVARARMSDLSNGAAALIGAVEVCKRLKRFPAAAHGYIAARFVKDEPLDVSAFRAEIVPFARIVGEELGDLNSTNGVPRVFPLLRALLLEQQVTRHPATAREWARGLALEIAVFQRHTGRYR